MQRDMRTLQAIADNMMREPGAQTTWPIGYALTCAIFKNKYNPNDDTARRIEAAFPELMNKYMPEQTEGKS